MPILRKLLDDHIEADAMADFMRAPLMGNLTEVPGVDVHAEHMLALAPNPIRSTFQLIGMVLLLKEVDMQTQQLITCEQHCSIVAQWLYGIGIANGAEIALTLIEKINTMMPGLYDADHIN